METEEVFCDLCNLGKYLSPGEGIYVIMIEIISFRLGYRACKEAHQQRIVRA